MTAFVEFNNHETIAALRSDIWWKVRWDSPGEGELYSEA
jgi:hypothetical protein